MRKKIADQIAEFFRLEARPGRSVEDWLFQDFPRGLDQITQHFDKEAEPSRAKCSDGLFENCKLKGMSFSHPAFDREYSAVQEICKAYGKEREAFDELTSKKEAYEQVSSQKVFFEQELLPRLKELQQGDALKTADYALLDQAIKEAGPLSRLYQEKVSDNLRADPPVYSAYKTLLTSLLSQTPKPPNWNKRLENTSRKLTQLPFGNR